MIKINRYKNESPHNHPDNEDYIESVKRNILVVDDDEFNLFLCETLLKEDFEVTMVLSGHEALKLAAEKYYDVVLLDINLNDENMDGTHVMRIMRQSDKHRRIKMFAMTAFSNDKAWYINEGFDDLLIKPLLEKHVIDIIERTLCQRVHFEKNEKNEQLHH